MDDIKGLVTRFYDTWNAHDREGWLACCGEDITFTGPGGVAGQGRDAVGIQRAKADGLSVSYVENMRIVVKARSWSDTKGVRPQKHRGVPVASQKCFQLWLV